MLHEPLEPWEFWVYPLVAVGAVVWLSWPLSIYWSQVIRWESVVWLMVGIGEIYRFRHKRPGLSRAILLALPLSLSYGLFNPGDARILFWMALGLFAYVWLLDSIPNALERLRQWLGRSKR